MSLLFRARPEAVKDEQRSGFSLAQLGLILSGQTDGLYSSVNPDSAMRHDAVWSCRTRIAQDVSMYPVDVVRYVDGRRREVSPAPQIIAAPSVNVSAMDWRYQVVDAWLGWGNAWGLVTATTTNGAYPARIELVNPTDVRWEKRDGRLRYFVNDVEHSLWPVGDLWHEPAYTLPGSPIGLSPIQYHAATITGGLNAGKFGSDFFTSGGLPSSILTVEGVPNEEQAKTLKQRLLAITKGNREPLVLPKGTEYKQISVNPNDSQFIESQRYTVEQVCRIFGEDPTDHGASVGGGSVTYANRLDADLARVKRRQFWITKLQDSLTRLIPKPQVVKLNTMATLMMTPRERYELHALKLENRLTTVNRVLTVEDEEPFDDPAFDLPGVPAATAAPQSFDEEVSTSE